MEKCQRAFHVTDIPGGSAKKYSSLKLHVADDAPYDGDLLGLPCVFFTTTLYKSNFPTESPYPRNGEVGSTFKVVRVPMTQFANHCVYQCATEHDNQIRLILLRMDEDATWIQKFDALIEAGSCYKKLDLAKNPFLACNTDGAWTTFQNPKNQNRDYKTVINFVVLYEFVISDECLWETTIRSKFGEGTPSSSSTVLGALKDRLLTRTLKPSEEEGDELRLAYNHVCLMYWNAVHIVPKPSSTGQKSTSGKHNNNNNNNGK